MPPSAQFRIMVLVLAASFLAFSFLWPMRTGQRTCLWSPLLHALSSVRLWRKLSVCQHPFEQAPQLASPFRRLRFTTSPDSLLACWFCSVRQLTDELEG
jgi:hypothetical protein